MAIDYTKHSFKPGELYELNKPHLFNTNKEHAEKFMVTGGQVINPSECQLRNNKSIFLCLEVEGDLNSKPYILLKFLYKSKLVYTTLFQEEIKGSLVVFQEIKS